VAVIVSAIVTAVSAGSLGPVCAGIVGSLVGAMAAEFAKKAIQGGDYSIEAGAEAVTKALVVAILTAGLGKGFDKLVGKPMEAVLGKFMGDITTQFPQLSKHIVAGTVKQLKTAVVDYPSNVIADVAFTEGTLSETLGSSAESELRKQGWKQITTLFGTAMGVESKALLSQRGVTGATLDKAKDVPGKVFDKAVVTTKDQTQWESKALKNSGTPSTFKQATVKDK